MSDQRNISFVVFSDDYGRHPSSSQHLFNIIAQRHRVLWVNTLGIRRPRADAFTFLRGLGKLKQWLRPLRRITDNLYVLSPIMWPTCGSGLLAAMNRHALAWQIRHAMSHLTIHHPVIFSSVPNAAELIGRLHERATIYYVTDNYSRWPQSDAATIDALDRRLAHVADHVLVCSHALADRYTRSEYFPHAVDQHWLATSSSSEPDDLASIPHPRICFFGLIYEKIDQHALATLASARPDLHIVMIGPIATSIESLTAHANIHFIAAKPYADLPRYLHAMDAILIPYILDAETQDKGPLKLRESLATGLPIVARRIPDFESFADSITLYDRPNDLADAVARAFSTDTSQLHESRRDRVRSDTWQQRASRIIELAATHASAEPIVTVNDIRVEITATQPDWSAFLHAHPDASLLHDPHWPRLIANVYGSSPVWFTARRNGRIVGTLQCVRQKHILLGSRITSLPWFDASGILASDRDAQNALIVAAERFIARSDVASIELRHNHPIDADLAARTDKVTFILSLDTNVDTLWQRLDGKVRNLVRRAEKNGLTVHIDTPESIDDFHRIYARTMRDLGSPPHSRQWFAEMRATFYSAVHTFIVRRDAQPLAAGWLLADGKIARLPWAAADHRYRDTAANMLLYWSMIAWAGERGFAAFDFGRCSRNAGTWRFKQQWGGVETPLYWHRIANDPSHTETPATESASLRFASKAFKYLPVPLATHVGPMLIRGLS